MSDTKYLIAQAAGSEQGDIHIPALLGDQTGHEIRTRKWYAHTPIWGKIFRFKDENVADEIATRMEHAIANGYVGYDTNHRHSFLEKLLDGRDVKSKYIWPIQAIDAVHQVCGTDCSALTYTAIRGATGVIYQQTGHPYDPIVPGLNQISPKVRQFDFYIERQCVNAGFEVTVFTLDTALSIAPPADQWVYSDSGDQDRKKCYQVNFKDGVTKYYIQPFYNTPYDYYDSKADSISVKNNLQVVYLTDTPDPVYGYTKDLLTSFVTYIPQGKTYKQSWLKRGDIIRTIDKHVGPNSYSGHIGVWV